MFKIEGLEELEKALTKEHILNMANEAGFEINCPHCNEPIIVHFGLQICPKCLGSINFEVKD